MPRAARERLILNVAGQVFARSGYHAAPMDEIADLAGVSKPMLYAYFGSKEGLYIAYVNRTGRELLDRMIGASGREDPPVTRLRKRVDEFFAFVEEHRDGWTVLFTAVTSSRPLEDEVAELRRQIAEAVRRWLEAAQPEGAGSLGTAGEAIAHAIVGAGESLANWWLEHPRVPREQVTDWFVGIVQAGLPAARARTSGPATARRPSRPAVRQP